jgi:hypothetical protein
MIICVLCIVHDDWLQLVQPARTVAKLLRALPLPVASGGFLFYLFLTHKKNYFIIMKALPLPVASGQCPLIIIII